MQLVINHIINSLCCLRRRSPILFAGVQQIGSFKCITLQRQYPILQQSTHVSRDPTLYYQYNNHFKCQNDGQVDGFMHHIQTIQGLWMQPLRLSVGRGQYVSYKNQSLFLSSRISQTNLSTLITNRAAPPPINSAPRSLLLPYSLLIFVSLTLFLVQKTEQFITFFILSVQAPGSRSLLITPYSLLTVLFMDVVIQISKLLAVGSSHCVLQEEALLANWRFDWGGEMEIVVEAFSSSNQSLKNSLACSPQGEARAFGSRFCPAQLFVTPIYLLVIQGMHFFAYLLLRSIDFPCS